MPLVNPSWNLMRAPFNDVVTVSTNDGSGFPVSVVFTRACRIVPANHISPSNPPLNAAYGYFTYAGNSVFAGSTVVVSTGYSVDWTDAYVIEFASLPGNRYVALIAEVVAPLTGLPYRRVWFTDMP